MAMDNFNNFLGFAGVAGAIIASMGLAMWLEWFCLEWLMRLMPGQFKSAEANSPATNATEPETAAAQGRSADIEMIAHAAAKPARKEIRLGI